MAGNTWRLYTPLLAQQPEKPEKALRLIYTLALTSKPAHVENRVFSAKLLPDESPEQRAFTNEPWARRTVEGWAKEGEAGLASFCEGRKNQEGSEEDDPPQNPL